MQNILYYCYIWIDMLTVVNVVVGESGDNCSYFIYCYEFNL